MISGVHFVDEAEICATGFATGPSQFLAADDELQDLKGFFTRPTLISRSSLLTAPGSFYSLPITWTNLVSEVPLWAERLRGVRGIRGTLVFRMEHNANPFHQGLLVASFQYGANQFLRGTRPATCTHLPHVKLNLSENTAAELRVPYLNEFEYIGSSTSEVSHVYGTFALTQVLGTPTLAGSTTPVVKVFVHLEDVEVFGRMPLAGGTFIVPQSGVSKARVAGVSNAEQELKNNGQFSGVLATAADLPKAVSRAFPSLRPFMGSVTWFLNASAKAASAFGFSKPVASAPLKRVAKFPNYCDQNVDVVTPATVVGGFQTNSVAVSSALGGTDLDEMAFDTILTRYSQIFRGSLSTSDAHAACRYCSHVALTHMWFRASTATDAGNVSFPRGSASFASVFPSTLLYFGQHFRYWHGGLKYRVTFAKSKFHTGRVMFSFIPNYRQISNTQQYVDASSEGGPAPGVFNTDLQPSQYSLVFDLKDSNEFEFEVPYFAPVAHLGINDSMGFVALQVMDPLVNNGESSATINFIVEVAAMPGFYFAGLGSPGQPVWGDSADPSPAFQSGIGGTQVDASQHSVGEKFTSAKQLAMSPICRRFDQANNSQAAGFVPHWAEVPNWPLTGAAITSGTTREMPFSRSGAVAQCYAYGIGSTLLATEASGLLRDGAFRVHLDKSDNGNATTTTIPSMYTQPFATPNTAWAYSSRDGGSAIFMLPTLCSTPRFRIGDFNVALTTRDYSPNIDNTITTSQTVKARYRFLVRNNNGAVNRWYWGVCAGDDARAAGYIGPAPLVVANSATTSGNWYTASSF